MTLRFNDRGRPAGLDWPVVSGGRFGNPDLTLLTETGAARNPVADLNRKRAATVRANRIDPQTEAEVIRLYVDEMKTSREVAEATGIRANTVSKILRRNGVESRSKSEAMRLVAARRVAG